MKNIKEFIEEVKDYGFYFDNSYSLTIKSKSPWYIIKGGEPIYGSEIELFRPYILDEKCYNGDELFFALTKDLKSKPKIFRESHNIYFRIMKGHTYKDGVPYYYLEIEFIFKINNYTQGYNYSFVNYIIGEDCIVVNNIELQTDDIKYVDFISIGDGCFIDKLTSKISSVSVGREENINRSEDLINKNEIFNLKGYYLSLYNNHHIDDDYPSPNKERLNHLFIKGQYTGTYREIKLIDKNHDIDGVDAMWYLVSPESARYNTYISGILIKFGNTIKLYKFNGDCNGIKIRPSTFSLQKFIGFDMGHLVFNSHIVKPIDIIEI